MMTDVDRDSRLSRTAAKRSFYGKTARFEIERGGKGEEGC